MRKKPHISRFIITLSRTAKPTEAHHAACSGQTGLQPSRDGGSDGLTDGSASDEEQGDDDSEDQAEQSHGEVVQTLDALGVSVMSHVVRGGHERRHKREDQGNAELTKQSERNGKADCRVGLEARSDSENGCHDAADDGVRRLSASDRHVADRHELIGTTHEKTGVEVAKDKTDDGAGDDGLIETRGS